MIYLNVCLVFPLVSSALIVFDFCVGPDMALENFKVPPPPKKNQSNPCGIETFEGRMHNIIICQMHLTFVGRMHNYLLVGCTTFVGRVHIFCRSYAQFCRSYEHFCRSYEHFCRSDAG